MKRMNKETKDVFLRLKEDEHFREQMQEWIEMGFKNTEIVEHLERILFEESLELNFTDLWAGDILSDLLAIAMENVNLLQAVEAFRKGD